MIIVIFFRVNVQLIPGADVELYMGPFEVVFDIPYDVGCYEIINPLLETPIAAGDTVTPSWCITECLTADITKRFACKIMFQLSLVHLYLD